jgi:hypothetical protein
MKYHGPPLPSVRTYKTRSDLRQEISTQGEGCNTRGTTRQYRRDGGTPHKASQELGWWPLVVGARDQCVFFNLCVHIPLTVSFVSRIGGYLGLLSLVEGCLNNTGIFSTGPGSQPFYSFPPPPRFHSVPPSTVSGYIL